MKDGTTISQFLSLVEIDGYDDAYNKDICDNCYFGMPLLSIVDAEMRMRAKAQRSIAYFSMEYGLASSFYNTFLTKRDIDVNNKVQEQEVFSNFRLADYFFTLKVDNVMDLPIYSGGLGVLAGDTVKTMADY